MKELFKEKARNIKIIICKEEILDPIEKNTKKNSNHVYSHKGNRGRFIFFKGSMGNAWSYCF